MKIAVIGVKGIPAKQWEIERYCQEFYPRIAERGHQVDLFIRPEYHQQPWFSVYYYNNIRAIALASIPGKKFNLLLNFALDTIWATFGNYDVIHIQGIDAAWFCWFPYLFSRAKIIVTSYQLECRRHKWRKAFGWLLRWIETTAINNTDEIVVVSRTLGEYLQKKYHIRPRYIPYAPRSYPKTDPEFTYGKTLGLEPKKYLLYVGDLTSEHQPDLLLKAFERIEKGWKLIIAGNIDTSVQYAIELLAIAMSRQDIIFTNKITGQHLAEIVKNAGLLVVPSGSIELRLPSTMLEAMREGVPVVANDTKIHRELLGKNRGLLFQSGELDSLTTKIQYALNQPQAMSAMTQRAQTYIAFQHNWDRVTYGNLSLYLKLTSPVLTQPMKYRVWDN